MICSNSGMRSLVGPSDYARQFYRDGGDGSCEFWASEPIKGLDEMLCENLAEKIATNLLADPDCISLIDQSYCQNWKLFYILQIEDIQKALRAGDVVLGVSKNNPDYLLIKDKLTSLGLLRLNPYKVANKISARVARAQKPGWPGLAEP